MLRERRQWAAELISIMRGDLLGLGSNVFIQAPAKLILLDPRASSQVAFWIDTLLSRLVAVELSLESSGDRWSHPQAKALRLATIKAEPILALWSQGSVLWPRWRFGTLQQTAAWGFPESGFDPRWRRARRAGRRKIEAALATQSRQTGT
jgi:hypothetical protein